MLYPFNNHAQPATGFLIEFSLDASNSSGSRRIGTALEEGKIRRVETLSILLEVLSPHFSPCKLRNHIATAGGLRGSERGMLCVVVSEK